MENKNYIEIFDENKIKKLEIILTFENPFNAEYDFIVYKEIDSSDEIFGGKIRKKSGQKILETNLIEKEKKFLEKVYEETMKT